MEWRVSNLPLAPSLVETVDKLEMLVPPRAPGNLFPGAVDRSRLKPTVNALSESPSGDFPPTQPGNSFPGVVPPPAVARKSTALVRRGSVGRNERNITICDLGTGSGCIAVALARELRQARIVATDISPAALAVARANARRHHVAECIHFVASDLFAAVDGCRFDVIVCNPPYVRAGDLQGLQPELTWEPRQALVGGTDGLALIRRALLAAPAHLTDGGWLLVEIGADQATAVLGLARAAGFKRVSVHADYAGLPRVVAARL